MSLTPLVVPISGSERESLKDPLQQHHPSNSYCCYVNIILFCTIVALFFNVVDYVNIDI
jgi:hypothetical protein